MKKSLKVLPFEISGNKNSPNLVIFLHGWPDHLTIWNKTIQNLNLNDSLILNITYPNYSDKETLKFGIGF